MLAQETARSENVLATPSTQRTEAGFRCPQCGDPLSKFEIDEGKCANCKNPLPAYPDDAQLVGRDLEALVQRRARQSSWRLVAVAMVLILAGLFLLFLPVSFVDDHGLFSKVFILMPLGLIFLLIGGLLIKQACGEKDSGGAWGSMFRFLQETPKFITPQHPPEPQGEGGPALSRHVTYHKRIVWVGGVFGGLGLVLGLLISLMVLNLATKRPGTWNLILMSPIVSAALFTFVGIAVACLFAPREFLCGPLGTKWMKLIGIRNILGARIVCALLSVIGILGMALLGWELIRRLW